MDRYLRSIIRIAICLLVVAVVGCAQDTGGSTSARQMNEKEKQLTGQLFDLINQDRDAAGLPPYSLDERITQAAMAHNQVMATTNCGLAHVCPGEPDVGQRISNAGVNWMASGENVAYSSASAWEQIEQIHKSMMAEKPPDDGHRVNLLSKDFHNIGVGILIDEKGQIWLTEDFTN